MFLNNRYLYFNPIENLIYKSKISWSIIESFIEDDSDISTFGFTIKKLSGSQDFFVENEEDLEKWLENFSRLGLMSGFDLDYVIIKNIDYGRSGLVSVCQDMLTGAEYAAKRIEKSKLTEPTQRKLLKNEIKSMRKVSSQHTVQLFRVYEDQDLIILIMEYLPHGNLLQRLQKIKTLGEKECSLLMRNIFEALQHFSMIDLLHRDLKLENILMCSNSNNFEIKIIDFGLSCSFNSCDFAKCGSPGFMAPEIFAAGHYDSKIDVFSAGVVCYAALTGKLPFAGKNLNSVVEKNERGEVSFENNDWKHFSPIALNFVRGLLAKNPSLRPNAEQALNHPWIARHIFKCESEIVSGFITFAESNRVNCN
jgi:serine/threonine protein kinase